MGKARRLADCVVLEDVPNVGPAVARDLRRLGVRAPRDLAGRDPYALYAALNRASGARHDPCVLDTFIAAVRFADGGPPRPWWRYTAERKRALAAQGAPAPAPAPPGAAAHDAPVYTLFGAPGSGSAAIEAALDLAHARWEGVHAASWAPGPGFARLRALNPLGLVPTLLLPDGSVLTESAAILIHLADAHPDSGLLPRAPAARAQALRGLVFIAAHCYAAVGILDHPERWCAGCDAATARRIRRGTRARLHRAWEVFADTFPATPWLGGGQPGALDLLAAVVSKWSGTRAHLAKARAAFHARLAAVDAHPRVAPVFARHGLSPKL